MVSRRPPHPAFRSARLLAAGVLVASLLLALGPAHAARLSGAVDHSFMSANETFDYVLSLAGGDGRAPPDLSPLTRDFDIVNRARRSRVEGGSARPVEVNEWVMTLAPKRTGTLTVPGLTVEGLTSAPLKVEVVPALPVEQAGEGPIFVRVDVGDVSPFAQSLIPVAVRIFDGVGMRQGRLGQPTADGAALTAQGGQRTYVKTIGNKRYGVVEQSFLMQPQRSGTVTIEPITVEASVPGRRNTARSALPNLLGQSVLSALNYDDVTARSQPVPVEVKPRPAGVEGWFLPAQSVSLTQDFAPAADQAKVGVALTRTLRLKARGASPNQLPPLPVTEVEGVRQYEDDSSSGQVMVEGMVGAELVKTISVVPTRAGPITLPAITVSWWNTEKNRPEQATLPSVTLNVAPVAGAAPSAAPAVVTLADVPPALAGAQAEARGLFQDAVAGLQRHLWAIGAAIALAAMLSGLLLGWRRLRRRRPRTPRTAPAPRRPRMRAPVYATADAAEKALARACRADDAEQAHGAFLAWLRLAAAEGAGRFHTPKMTQAVRELSEALYGTQATQWRGRGFLSAFNAEKRARRRSERRARHAPIAPLYPTR